jgi:hypothetical protein
LVHWQPVGTAKHTGNGEFEFDGPGTDNVCTIFFRVLAP